MLLSVKWNKLGRERSMPYKLTHVRKTKQVDASSRVYRTMAGNSGGKEDKGRKTGIWSVWVEARCAGV